MMKPIVLAILDGFGYREEKKGNAIATANKPNIDTLWQEYPHSLLEASGESVGLPSGQMGNSEVGHLNIGAGRIVYQPLQLINKSIQDRTFFENEQFLKLIHYVKEKGSKLHLLGLLSDGGIHSHINHFYALLELAKQEGLEEVYVHAFLDGRDTLPDVAITYLDALSKKMQELGIGKIVDISGRYYSMDRERMWNLTEQYYNVLVRGMGPSITDYKSYIQDSYQKGIYDEFIVPALLSKDGLVENEDGLIFVNFRPDRATQLFTALTNPEFKEFKVDSLNIKVVTMMPVEHTIISTPAFIMPKLDRTLGMYLAEKNYKVLRIAEASKYPHVTYFFDGGLELELKGTDKIIVPRKDVATYDLYPAMSSYEVTDQLLKVINQYDVVILNFANCDMVGHTGNFEATVKAVEAVDENVGRIKKKVDELGGLLIVTADHGNAEYMENEEGEIITSHTCNLVPFIVCDKVYQVKNGKLGDIAPTILEIMQEDIPSEMTGNVLIKCDK